MALTPDTGESFVREVDENLRRDQMRDTAKRYGTWIVIGVVLFLIAVGGYLFWQNRQAKIASEQSETLSAALDKVGTNNVKGAVAELTPLSDSNNDIVRASAILARASLAVRQNNRAEALRLFNQVAADESLPQPLRDLGTVRAVAIEYDQVTPDQVIAKLAPLAKPGQPFFGTAGEMTAMAMLAKNDRAGAGALFQRVAADAQVPETIRSRAVQIAGSLGVDATASMPGDPSAAPAL